MRAQQAGYDGVERMQRMDISFARRCRPLVNKRTDCYGGSLANRARIITEIAEKSAAAAARFFGHPHGRKRDRTRAAAETISAERKRDTAV